MRIHELATLVFLLAPVAPVHANGGGYFRGGVEQAGDVTGFEPKATENIRILDEKLTIRLGQKHADVEVRYLMRNETANKVKVRFGFPVEESFDRSLYDEKEDKKLAARRQLAYCKHYEITASAKLVKATWKDEANETHDKRFKGIAGWMISEITFDPNEEKPVMIRFQSAYPAEEWSVSYSGSRSPALFRYRLSTAACWAGTIGEGTIVIEPNGVNSDLVRVIKPVNRFHKKGETWVWNFKNLDPTMADDLTIEAKPGETYRPGPPTSSGGLRTEFVERNKRWTMAHSNYRVTASSTLPDEGNISYHPEQIRDRWSTGMWSEGAKGPGIGEWLELEPEVAKPLSAISIVPGCIKTDELFQDNARPKRILVELNGGHRFSVNVPDSKEEFEFPVTGYDKPVKTVRLTFKEVWPGKRFEDLCVTAVRLHARLDKEPKSEPSR